MQKQTGVVWGEKGIGYGFHHITLPPVSELADCPQQVLHRVLHALFHLSGNQTLQVKGEGTGETGNN